MAHKVLFFESLLGCLNVLEIISVKNRYNFDNEYKKHKFIRINLDKTYIIPLK